MSRWSTRGDWGTRLAERYGLDSSAWGWRWWPRPAHGYRVRAACVGGLSRRMLHVRVPGIGLVAVKRKRCEIDEQHVWFEWQAVAA